MDDLDWKIMMLIYNNKSLSKISDELFLSQPAITYRIRKIEKFFQTKLISRTNKGYQITLQGEMVAKYAKEHLEHMKKLQEDIFSSKDMVQGKLYIGASSAIAQYLLPPLLSDFLNRNDKVSIDLITGFSPSLTESLHHNKIHIAFLRENIEWGAYKQHLVSDGIYLVSKEKVELADIPNMTRVNYKTNFSLKNLIDNWWTDHFNSHPKSVIEVDNAEACKEVVRSGLGYSILTGLTLNNQDDLYCLPLSSKQFDLKRNVWMYASEQAMQYITVRSFWDYISDKKDIIYDGK